MRTRVLWLALLVSACSSNDDTTKEQHAFVDADGRSCQAMLEKTSPSAPVLSQAISCDGEGRDCSAESRACFQLSINAETFEIQNCPACCQGAASSYYAADCSGITCTTGADCVYERAICTDGACFCPGGACD